MQIVSTTPQDGQTGIGILEVIKITFDNDIDPTSISQSSIVLVTLDKDTVVVDALGVPIATERLIDRSLFTDTFNKAVDGQVYVDPDDTKTLCFKPKVSLKVYTEYKVIVSSTIADATGMLLGNIYAFTFTTTSEQQVLSTPVDESETILGSNLIVETQDTSPTLDPNKLSIVSSDPENEQIFVGYKTWTIVFNKDIDAQTVDNIKVYATKILEDGTSSIDITATVNNTVVTITPTDANIDLTNQEIEIRILPGLTAVDGTTFGNVQNIMFFFTMDPYYGSISLTRFLAGVLLNGIKDATIAVGLYYYSSLANRIFRGLRMQFKQEVLNRYTVINVLHTLLTNKLGSGINSNISKTLGDFKIEIDNGLTAKLNNSLLAKLEAEVQSLNLYVSMLRSKPLMRGVDSVDYPTDIGRLWDLSNANIDHLPMEKHRYPGSYRSKW